MPCMALSLGLWLEEFSATLWNHVTLQKNTPHLKINGCISIQPTIQPCSTYYSTIFNPFQPTIQPFSTFKTKHPFAHFRPMPTSKEPPQEAPNVNDQLWKNRHLDPSRMGLTTYWLEEIPFNQLRLVVYPILYKVLFIPGGAGFLPSTVSLTNLCWKKSSWTSWNWINIPYPSISYDFVWWFLFFGSSPNGRISYDSTVHFAVSPN